MKMFLIVLAILGLAGCGKIDRQIASITGDPTAVCYKGVEYVQFTSGSSVAYNTDGTVKTCDKK